MPPEYINLLEMENSKLNELHIIIKERSDNLVKQNHELEEKIREMLLNNKSQN